MSEPNPDPVAEAADILHGLFLAAPHRAGCLYLESRKHPCQCGAADRYHDLQRRAVLFARAHYRPSQGASP